jgi:hypothetical protein
MTTRIRVAAVLVLVCAVALSATANPNDISGTWCADTEPGELGPGSPGGCGDFEIDLARHGNKVTGTVFFEDDGGNEYRADYEFVRRGPGPFHYDLTVTITVVAGTACNMVATFTGDGEIDHREGLLTATASGTNTDCIDEVQEYRLAKQ